MARPLQTSAGKRSAGMVGSQWQRLRLGKAALVKSSDPHRHNDIAVVVIVIAFRAERAGRLRVLELQADFQGVGSLEEVEQVGRVEADGHRIAGERYVD